MNLTKENYFTSCNRYLTNSKINDWLKCKNYFYRKHIACELVQPKTKAMLIGSLVDDLLTNINEAMAGKIVSGDRRLKEFKQLEAQGVTVISVSDYDMIMGLATSVDETSAYKELRDHTTQTIVGYDEPIGEHFVGLAGIPDWFKVDGHSCIITDLKTANTIDPRKYFFHCQEFGYFRQQAVYQMILKKLYPEIRDFVSRHIVVEKEKDINLVRTFIIPQDIIEEEKINIQDYISEISLEKEFKKEDADWDNAVTLGEF